MLMSRDITICYLLNVIPLTHNRRDRHLLSNHYMRNCSEHIIRLPANSSLKNITNNPTHKQTLASFTLNRNIRHIIQCFITDTVSIRQHHFMYFHHEALRTWRLGNITHCRSRVSKSFSNNITNLTETFAVFFIILGCTEYYNTYRCIDCLIQSHQLEKHFLKRPFSRLIKPMDNFYICFQYHIFHFYREFTYSTSSAIYL